MSSILRAGYSGYTRERRLRVEFTNVENRVAIDFAMAATRALFLESEPHRGELGLTDDVLRLRRAFPTCDI